MVASKKDVRVLVVDDSKSVRLNVRSFLRDLGFVDIDLAEDGLQAMEKLQSGMYRYGLIISDWNMEKMNGYELLRAVRSDILLKTIPFIMITANNSPENIVQAKQAGVSNYIMKPFTIATLRDRLQATLGPLA
jgi:two-component system, chemotaxis family, chemotaxis protein CheY